MVSGTISLAFSAFFSPFPHGTSSLSVIQMYLALADGAARFRQGFTGPALLRILLTSFTLHVRAFHPLWGCFPGSFHSRSAGYKKSYNPTPGKPKMVWAVSRSLATTWEITVVFSSFSYLDVSVRRVCPPRKEYPDHSGWVAPFGHPRINASLQLPAAFRSLARPSSPLYA